MTYANGTSSVYAYETDSALDSIAHAFMGCGEDYTATFDYNLVNQVTSEGITDAV